jgi:Fe-S cluster assembly iron-binding protein IscA
VVDVTLAASMQLRALVRSAGVAGMPGVRVRARDGVVDFDISIEDRMQPGDEISESRGIRFYIDDGTASTLGEVMLDLEGEQFVLRQVRPV